MMIKLFFLMRSFSNSTSREIHKMTECIPQRKGEISTERMVVKRKTFPKNVMISVGVSKLGRTSVFFVELGVKINGHSYRNELLARMLPEMNNLCRADYIFLQDGARFHTAKATLEYLNENCPAYVKPDHWTLLYGVILKRKLEKQTAWCWKS